MPKVSVIIPTYNRADVVVDAVRSVLDQTVKDLEVIVVDDGSTDTTRQVVEAMTDPRIRYYYKQNSGPSGARNVGLDKAAGDCIAFLDHDDLWPENFLEVMTSALEKNTDYGVVYCPITIAWPDGRQQKSYKIGGCKSGWVAQDLFKTGFVWTSAALIRREVLENFRYDEALTQSYEDGDFFLRLSLRTQYLFTREVEAVKRTHDNNFSTVVGVRPTRILVLERFYYQCGGDKVVPRKIAMRRLSHARRKVAKAAYTQKSRAMALTLYKHAISDTPGDMRLYPGLFKAWLLSPANDPQPDWRMPAELAKDPKVSV